MKNIKNLIGLLLMAAIIGFTSCSEDDDDDAIGPALDVNIIGETTVTPSSTVVVTWEARDGDAKLDYFTILEGNTAVQGWNQKEIPNDLNETYNDTAYLQAPATDGNSTTFTFTVTDKDGLEKSVSKTITAEAQNQTLTAKSFTLNDDNNSGTIKGEAYFSVSNEAKYTEATATNIDLIYGYDNTDYKNTQFQLMHFFVSPKEFDDNNLGGGTYSNSTTIKSAPAGTDFENATSTIVNNAFTNGDLTSGSGYADGKIAINISNGDIYAIQTQSGTNALIKITSLSAGSITFDIKIAE